MSRKPRLIIIPPQHLGHEIHVARCIVIDMLIKGFLSVQHGDCVMTGLSDRRFFYESLFDIGNVFDFSILSSNYLIQKPPKTTEDYSNFPTSKFYEFEELRKFKIINLSIYSLPPPFCTFSTSDEMVEIGYDIPDRYWSDDFVIKSQSFNFSTLDPVVEYVNTNFPLFILIHHRYNAPFAKLQSILNSLPTLLPKIIFCNERLSIERLLPNSENLLFIDNLNLYATLLNNIKCKLLITEWSGAGQLAQYILGPHGAIWHYYDHYKDIFNFTKSYKIWEHNAKIGSYFNCWDHKVVTGCDTQHFSSHEDLLLSLKNISLTF